MTGYCDVDYAGDHDTWRLTMIMSLILVLDPFLGVVRHIISRTNNGSSRMHMVDVTNQKLISTNRLSSATLL